VVEKNGVTYNALEINVSVSQDTACKIYGSCNKVPEAATISSNSQGFLQFQADSSLERGFVKMRLDFMDKPPTGRQLLSFDAASCNFQPENNILWDYVNVTKCQCKVCTASCDKNQIVVKFPSFFSGFNWKIVLIAYGCIIGLGFLLWGLRVIGRTMKQKTPKQKESVKEELTYMQPKNDNDD